MAFSDILRKIKNTVRKATPIVKVLKYIPGIGIVATAAEDISEAIITGKRQGDVDAVRQSGDRTATDVQHVMTTQQVVPNHLIVGLFGLGAGLVLLMVATRVLR